MEIMKWIEHQNWWILIPAIMGYLNVIVAATKVMGWTKISTFCGKLEDAIAAGVQAWINRRKSLTEIEPRDDTKVP